MCFAQRACTRLHQREEEPLEEAGRFVEGLFQRVVYVYVQFFGFVDVVADAVEEDGVDEFLGDEGFAGDEDAGGGVDSVGGPVFGLGDFEEGLPLGEGWEYFEGFGERAGFVAGEEEADSVVCMLGVLFGILFLFVGGQLTSGRPLQLLRGVQQHLPLRRLPKPEAGHLFQLRMRRFSQELNLPSWWSVLALRHPNCGG